MLQPGLTGAELVLNNKQSFVGYNLGYIKLFSEHSIGPHEFVYRTNVEMEFSLRRRLKACNLKDGIKLNKDIHYKQKLANKWKKTKFCADIISPYVDIFNRKIAIDNSDLTENSLNLLCESGEYNILAFGRELHVGALKRVLHNRKKINESEIFNIHSYNFSSTANTDYIEFIRSQEQMFKNYGINIIGAWTSGIILIVIKNSSTADVIIDSIIDAIKNARLAVVQSENNLFSNRGCCIIDLEKAYKQIGSKHYG